MVWQPGISAAPPPPPDSLENMDLIFLNARRIEV
jgi:hypothetical protein